MLPEKITVRQFPWCYFRQIKSRAKTHINWEMSEVAEWEVKLPFPSLVLRWGLQVVALVIVKVGEAGGWDGEGVCYKNNMRLKRQRLVLKVIHSASKVAFQEVSFTRHAEHSLLYKTVLLCDSPFPSSVTSSDIQSHCHHSPKGWMLPPTPMVARSIMPAVGGRCWLKGP